MSFVSYAQNLEDVMLQRALKDVAQGFYIDIGAQDPESDSVSLAFYRNGWRGIHVEPNTQYARLLRAARPDEVVEQVAIGTVQGSLTFYEFSDTGLSTADTAIAQAHQAAGYNCEETQVSVLTCDELLERHGASRPVHWLKIDVEGFEKQVLESWKISQVRPWILVIESTMPRSQISVHEEWESLVLEKGYLFAYFDGLNRFYVHETQKERLAAFSSPPNIFDEFIALGGAAQGFYHEQVEAVRHAELPVDRAESALAKARAQLASAEVLTAQAEARAADMEAKHLAILHSTCWRITAPLRAVISAMKFSYSFFLRAPLRLVRCVRWTKFQIQLLRDYGFASRFSALKRRLKVQETGNRPRVFGPILEKRFGEGKYGEALTSRLRSLRKDSDNAVSIIIINYNSDDLIFHCLSQLAASDFDGGLEVVVVNNDPSSVAMSELHAMGDAIILVDNKVNRYFGEANNIGVERSSGKYVCFLNADAFVDENCITRLHEVISNTEKYSAVGPKFLYSNGVLQEAGALIGEDGNPVMLGVGQSPDKPEFNRERAVDYISAACLMMRRDVFCAVDGFDLRYEPAYYEDVDLCLKLKTHGQIGYIPGAHVWHLQGGTVTNDSQRDRVMRVIDLNREKFISTWRSPTGATWKTWSAPRARQEAPAGAGVVAVYTPYGLTVGGGERYVFTLLDTIAKQYGLTPVIVTAEPYSKLRINQLCQAFELESDIQIMMLSDFLKGPAPEFFFALGNHPYPPLDGAGKFNVFICQFPFPGQYEGAMRGSIQTYQDTIVYSAFVKEQLSAHKEFNGGSISVVEPILPWSAEAISGYVSERQMSTIEIITVGRFFAGGHSKQHGRLIQFFKKLHGTHPNIRLHIVGATMPHKEHMAYLSSLRADAADLPIEFHLNAEPDLLKNLYGRSHIYWHGTGMGVDAKTNPERLEHFGISVIEAMSFGCVPVVHQSGGPLSILGKNLEQLAYTDEAAFLAINRRLFDNPRDLVILGEKAKTRALEFDLDHFASKLRTVLGK